MAIAPMMAILLISAFTQAHSQKLIASNESRITVDDKNYCGSSNFELTRVLIKDVLDKVVSSSKSGSQIVIEISVASNCALDDYPVLAFLGIEGSDGSTRYLAYQNFTMNPEESYTAGFSWVPADEDDYRVGVVLHSCLPCSGDFGIGKRVDFSVNDIPAVVTLADEPIGPSNLAKINDIQVKEKRVKDPSFDLIAEPAVGGIGVIFTIVNIGDEDKPTDIDGWKVQAFSNTFTDQSVGVEQNPAIKTGIIRTSESQLIMVLDDLEDTGWFEGFPGTHTLLLMGFNMEDWKRFDELEEEGIGEYEDEDRASYLLKVDVVIGFDEELLRASKSKVILANNTIMAIQGNTSGSNLFEITDDEPKTIIFSIKNNYNYPVSAKLDDAAVWVWHAGTAASEVLGGGEVDYFSDSCFDILMPGESIEVESVTLKKDAFPLGSPSGTGRGISAQLDSNIMAKEGTYVVLISGGTFSCATDDGKRVPGILYTGAVAFEVR